MNADTTLRALTALAVLAIASCAAPDLPGISLFVQEHLTSDTAIIRSDIGASIERIDPAPLEWSGQQFQIEPGEHWVEVAYEIVLSSKTVGSHTSGNLIVMEVLQDVESLTCSITYTFEPGKLYHIARQSVDDKGRVKFFNNPKSLSIVLREDKSDVLLAMCAENVGPIPLPLAEPGAAP